MPYSFRHFIPTKGPLGGCCAASYKRRVPLFPQNLLAKTPRSVASLPTRRPKDSQTTHADAPHYPTTAFMLRLSKKPWRSSFLTSTTQCSKLSMRTRALVSATTSWNAVPNLFSP